MTRVVLNYIRETGPLYFDCCGHSDYKNDNGYNDVCAEVSTLCSMLVRYVVNLGIEPPICKDGHVRIYIKCPCEKINEVFGAAMLEFRHLANNYPEHIKVY
ncbi:MAG: ribosomal-processing cysteine protease Prp [Bacillota bacterium]|nr:ribosomal-processing cysteine protease Prp [Bacillota bacterium]